MLRGEFDINIKVANIEKIANGLEQVLGFRAYQFSERSDSGVEEPDAIYGYHINNPTLHLALKDPRKGRPDFKLCKVLPARGECTDSDLVYVRVMVDTERATVSVDELREQLLLNLKPWWTRLGVSLAVFTQDASGKLF